MESYRRWSRVSKSAFIGAFLAAWCAIMLGTVSLSAHAVESSSRLAATTVAKTTQAAVTTQPAAGIPMYRLYNPKTEEHFYTASLNEKRVLTQQHSWRFEGIAWYAPKTSNTPVYRLYQASSNAHHYTTSAHERDVLKKRGWRYEGIGWYSDDAKTVAVHRLLKPGRPMISAHHYTTSTHERNVLTSSRGWKSEGIGWYALAFGHSIKDGWIKQAGKWTYWLEGTQVKGSRWIVTTQKATAQSDNAKNRYRLDKNGNAITGFFKVDGKQYYANPSKVHVERNTIVMHNGIRYRANGEGALSKAKLRVYLDAGHGWGYGKYDPGAVAHGYHEHTLTSDLARRVLARTKNMAGVEVIDGRAYRLPYYVRPQKAAALGCDLILSIHFNAGTSNSGTMTLIGGSNRPAKERIWNDIVHSKVIAALGLPDQGTIRRGDLKITNGTVPCVLVEVCHMDLWRDLNRYNSRRDRVAQSLADAIAVASRDPRI